MLKSWRRFRQQVAAGLIPTDIAKAEAWKIALSFGTYDPTEDQHLKRTLLDRPHFRKNFSEHYGPLLESALGHSTVLLQATGLRGLVLDCTENMWFADYRVYACVESQHGRGPEFVSFLADRDKEFLNTTEYKDLMMASKITHEFSFHVTHALSRQLLSDGSTEFLGYYTNRPMW